MITPSPTTKLEVGLARGTFGGMTPAAPTKAACVRFVVPNTSYELHLLPLGEVAAEVGKRMVGVIRAKARRMDVVQTGGRYVEPVCGRPRRVQGRVVKIEGEAVVVDAGVAIHCVPTDPRQSAGMFEVGALVSCDVMDGATIEARS